jgi:hypothetical protein
MCCCCSLNIAIVEGHVGRAHGVRIKERLIVTHKSQVHSYRAEYEQHREHINIRYSGTGRQSHDCRKTISDIT